MNQPTNNSQAFSLLELLVAISIATLLAILCFKLFFSSSKLLSYSTHTPTTQIHSFAQTLTKDLESLYFDQNHPLLLTTDAASNSELSFYAFISGTRQPITYQVQNKHLLRKSPSANLKIPIKNFNIKMLTRSHDGSQKWVTQSTKASISYIHFQLNFLNKNGQPQILEQTVFPMTNLPHP